MMAPLRLYKLVGCPKCDEAEVFLAQKGVPGEKNICGELGGEVDPIVDAGIRARTGLDVGTYPILVCYLTEEVIVGFLPREYERICNAVLARYGASAPAPAPPQGEPVRQGEGVPAVAQQAVAHEAT